MFRREFERWLGKNQSPKPDIQRFSDTVGHRVAYSLILQEWIPQILSRQGVEDQAGTLQRAIDVLHEIKNQSGLMWTDVRESIEHLIVMCAHLDGTQFLTFTERIIDLDLAGLSFEQQYDSLLPPLIQNLRTETQLRALLHWIFWTRNLSRSSTLLTVEQVGQVLDAFTRSSYLDEQLPNVAKFLKTWTELRQHVGTERVLTLASLINCNVELKDPDIFAGLLSCLMNERWSRSAGKSVESSLSLLIRNSPAEQLANFVENNLKWLALAGQANSSSTKVYRSITADALSTLVQSSDLFNRWSEHRDLVQKAIPLMQRVDANVLVAEWIPQLVQASYPLVGTAERDDLLHHIVHNADSKSLQEGYHQLSEIRYSPEHYQVQFNTLQHLATLDGWKRMTVKYLAPKMLELIKRTQGKVLVQGATLNQLGNEMGFELYIGYLIRQAFDTDHERRWEKVQAAVERRTRLEFESRKIAAFFKTIRENIAHTYRPIVIFYCIMFLQQYDSAIKRILDGKAIQEMKDALGKMWYDALRPPHLTGSPQEQQQLMVEIEGLRRFLIGTALPRLLKSEYFKFCEYIISFSLLLVREESGDRFWNEYFSLKKEYWGLFKSGMGKMNPFTGKYESLFFSALYKSLNDIFYTEFQRTHDHQGRYFQLLNGLQSELNTISPNKYSDDIEEGKILRKFESYPPLNYGTQEWTTFQ